MKVDEDQAWNQADAPVFPNQIQPGNRKHFIPVGTLVHRAGAHQGNSPTQHRCHSVIWERLGWFYYREQNAGEKFKMWIDDRDRYASLVD